MTEPTALLLVQALEHLTAAIGSPTAQPPTTPPPTTRLTTAPEPSDSEPDDPRRVAHELLGQAHAFMTVAVRPDLIDLWCPQELRDSFLASSAEVATAIGRAHAEVGSGEHDARLTAAGIGGAPGRPKRAGLRRALQRLLGAAVSAPHPGTLRQRLRECGEWAQIALGSIGTILPAAELAAEAIEVVMAATQTDRLDTRDWTNGDA